MAEEWRPVVGYEGYYDVSSLGHVRRMKPANSTRIGRTLKGSADNGYIRVDLSKDNNAIHYRIHQLVSAAFIGPCPEGKQINHKDGIKTNNVVSNLEYVTLSENQLHAYRLGLRIPTCGERHGQSKLTEDNVRAIRERLLLKESHRSIAKDFNVVNSAISLISAGKRWGWLDAC